MVHARCEDEDEDEDEDRALKKKRYDSKLVNTRATNAQIVTKVI